MSKGIDREYIKFFSVIAGILVVAYILTLFYQNTTFWLSYMRYIMGVFFIVFSLFQFLGYKSFVIMFADYDPFAKLTKFYAYLYPFLGFLLGIFYLFDLFIPWRDIITAIIMLVGAYGIWKNIKIKKDEVHCACLGNIIKIPLSTVTLVEDLVMGIMALIMIVVYVV